MSRINVANFRHPDGTDDNITLDSSGRVGVGTASPASKIHVYENSASPARIYLENTEGRYEIKADANLALHYSNQFVFNNAAGTQEFARIDSSGKLLVGTSSATGDQTGAKLVLQGSSQGELYLSRGSTPANNGAGLGFVVFTGDNGIDAARIQAHSDGGTWTNGSSHPTRLTFWTTADGASTPTERLRIDSSGRLLVGLPSAIQSANSLIQVVNQTGGYYIAARNDPSVSANNHIGGMRFYGNDSDGNYDECARIECTADGTHSNDSKQSRLAFFTTAGGAVSPTERMRIDKDGQTNFYGNLTGLQVRTGQGNNTSSYIYTGRYGATSTQTGTISFGVRANGNVENQNNSYGAISDVKLKENIADANTQWDDLKALRVRNYNFKPETGYGTHTQIGLVAQEAELVCPGLVTESPDRDDEGNDLGTVTKSVNYSVLYMKAVKALQEAMERIETLEQRLSDAGIA